MTLRNDGDKTIQSVEWDYLFIDLDTQQEVARHRFSSKQPVQPRKSKIITELSPAPPTKVISLKALTERSEHPFLEKVIIRRVTYADGSVWQLSATSP